MLGIYGGKGRHQEKLTMYHKWEGGQRSWEGVRQGMLIFFDVSDNGGCAVEQQKRFWNCIHTHRIISVIRHIVKAKNAKQRHQRVSTDNLPNFSSTTGKVRSAQNVGRFLFDVFVALAIGSPKRDIIRCSILALEQRGHSHELNHLGQSLSTRAIPIHFCILFPHG